MTAAETREVAAQECERQADMHRMGNGATGEEVWVEREIAADRCAAAIRAMPLPAEGWQQGPGDVDVSDVPLKLIETDVEWVMKYLPDGSV